MIFAPKLWGTANSSCMCGKHHANSSGQDLSRRSPTSLFRFPISCHSVHACLLSFAPGVPNTCSTQKAPSTPRQNSGPVTRGPLNFQSQNPTAASLFLLIYVLTVSPEKLQGEGMEGRAHLFTAVSPEFYFHLLLFKKKVKVKELHWALSAQHIHHMKQRSHNFTDEDTEAHGGFTPSPRLPKGLCL